MILGHVVVLVGGIGCVVLIDDTCAQVVFVVRNNIGCTVIIQHEDATASHAAAISPETSFTVEEDIIQSRNTVQFTVIEAFPCAIGV